MASIYGTVMLSNDSIKRHILADTSGPFQNQQLCANWLIIYLPKFLKNEFIRGPIIRDYPVIRGEVIK